MAPRLEPTYPSFSLVLSEAMEPFQLPPYDSPYDQGSHPCSAHSPTQLEDRLMSTVDYRFNDPYFVPTMSWNSLQQDFWDEDPNASNLQAALETGKRHGARPRRRRLSDLVIDLALRIRQTCSVRSLRRQRMEPLVRVSYLDLAA
ncbi:hypothetical protein OE88DRAFT_1732130 [Heliocybe sulcata]|uniref:Uncharacterized protein n=1 Tax=Heliocybe sulcata TaxID=5364 RepID=A0A5C3NAY2_9AGAM|nr:hypothetical protein OE88DRAFT_1732130 [Heliocybe sulcata]